MLPLKRIPFSIPQASAHFSGSRVIAIPISHVPARTTRGFASSMKKDGQNRIFSPIRNPPDLSTYISLSTSTSKPLLTLWTTSYCSSCRQISPLLHQIISSGVGEKEGGVLFAEVEYDAPDIMNEGLGLRYMVSSVPCLVGFWRGEVIGGGGSGVWGGGAAGGDTGGRLSARDIQSLGKEGLEEWVRGAAERGRDWREGHPGGEGLFGGLFKGWGK